MYNNSNCRITIIIQHDEEHTVRLCVYRYSTNNNDDDKSNLLQDLDLLW
jgi:hypothetical protein